MDWKRIAAALRAAATELEAAPKAAPKASSEATAPWWPDEAAADKIRAAYEADFGRVQEALHTAAGIPPGAAVCVGDIPPERRAAFESVVLEVLRAAAAAAAQGPAPELVEDDPWGDL